MFSCRYSSDPQVPTSLLRQSQHHHSLSTPSPLPTPPPSASASAPSHTSRASQASPTHSQVKKNRYVEIDVFPDSNYSSPRSLVIKKSSSAGSVSQLEGNLKLMLFCMQMLCMIILLSLSRLPLTCIHVHNYCIYKRLFNGCGMNLK